MSPTSYLAAPPRDKNSMVGLGRLELPTSRLSGVRSNQLSYRPLSYRHKVKLLLLQQLYFANKLIKELSQLISEN
jgi:hypothetical protein